MAEYIKREAAIDCLMEILDKPHHAEFLYTYVPDYQAYSLCTG